MLGRECLCGKPGSCPATLQTSSSYTVHPDVRLQWSEKQLVCFICLLKRELQNFPRKSDIKEHHICKAFDPGNGNAIVIGMILILFPLVTS